MTTALQRLYDVPYKQTYVILIVLYIQKYTILILNSGVEKLQCWLNKYINIHMARYNHFEIMRLEKHEPIFL